jgi:sRNA-binding protein
MHPRKAAPGVADAEDLKTTINADRDLLNRTGTTSPANRARDQNIAAVLDLLAETWPKCFFIYEQRRLPLKIGIHQDIIAVLDGAGTPIELRRALAYYCRNRSYLRHLRAGAVRIDLDGNPAGTVTAGEVRGPKVAERQPLEKFLGPGPRFATVEEAEAGIQKLRHEHVYGAPKKTDRKTTPKAPETEKARRLGLADLKRAALQRKPVSS